MHALHELLHTRRRPLKSVRPLPPVRRVSLKRNLQQRAWFVEKMRREVFKQPQSPSGSPRQLARMAAAEAGYPQSADFVSGHHC